VGCRLKGMDRDQVAESLEELARLADTAGAVEVGCQVCDVKRRSPSTFIGKGSIERIRAEIEDQEEPLRCVIFDVDFSPSQQRNLEEALDVMVIDRTGIILDIFAKRAHTAEGKLQVELAQYQYLLPRLRGMWTHLSRQGGGIGTRGPGETDLEVDRRRIRQRITMLEKRLEKVRSTRGLHRSERRKQQIPTIALVGYTNAGKSTLLNALTDAGVFTEDRLFATLDPTAREMLLPGNVKAIAIDTVGFIQRLPHQLVESFKATLEEVELADLIVHIMDASHPRLEEQSVAVLEVLRDIGVSDRVIANVFNKSDEVASTFWLKRQVDNHPPAVAVSALKRQGLDDLRAMLASILGQDRARVLLRIPLGRPDLLYRVRRGGEVIEETMEDNHVLFDVRLDKRRAGQLREYHVSEDDA
jgi:GTPase